MELKLKVPSASEQGYLRREQERVEFYRRYIQLPQSEQIPALVEYLAQFVDDPAAVDMLWDATKEQIDELVAIFVLGKYPRAEIDDPEEGSSEAG